MIDFEVFQSDNKFEAKRSSRMVVSALASHSLNDHNKYNGIIIRIKHKYFALKLFIFSGHITTCLEQARFRLSFLYPIEGIISQSK